MPSHRVAYEMSRGRALPKNLHESLHVDDITHGVPADLVDESVYDGDHVMPPGTAPVHQSNHHHDRHGDESNDIESDQPHQSLNMHHVHANELAEPSPSVSSSIGVSPPVIGGRRSRLRIQRDEGNDIDLSSTELPAEFRMKYICCKNIKWVISKFYNS